MSRKPMQPVKPLVDFLKARQMSVEKYARAIGVRPRTVTLWIEGGKMPNYGRVGMDLIVSQDQLLQKELGKGARIVVFTAHEPVTPQLASMLKAAGLELVGQINAGGSDA